MQLNDFNRLITQYRTAGARDVFQTLSMQVLKIIESNDIHELQIGARSGDGGIDLYQLLGDNHVKIWQVKAFFDTISDSQWQKITGSYNTVINYAITQEWIIDRWVLVIPINMDRKTLPRWNKWILKNRRDPVTEIGLFGLGEFQVAYNDPVVYQIINNSLGLTNPQLSRIEQFIRRNPNSDLYREIYDILLNFEDYINQNDLSAMSRRMQNLPPNKVLEIQDALDLSPYGPGSYNFEFRSTWGHLHLSSDSNQNCYIQFNSGNRFGFGSPSHAAAKAEFLRIIRNARRSYFATHNDLICSLCQSTRISFRPFPVEVWQIEIGFECASCHQRRTRRISTDIWDNREIRDIITQEFYEQANIYSIS